jgi:hypothetical protein
MLAELPRVARGDSRIRDSTRLDYGTVARPAWR